MRPRQAIADVASHYDDKHWWLERLQQRFVSPVLAALNGRDGIDVVERDWDNLLILDACRVDMFESVADTERFDTYKTVRSHGSSSPDWIAANFADRELIDTVYVTANPWVAQEAPSSFHEIMNVWAAEQTNSGDIDAGDLAQRDLATSPAATVTAKHLNEAVRQVKNDYPNKRYIVHYFQPHAPCIGNADGSIKSEEEMNLLLHPGKPLYEGRVDRDTVWEAYEDNLAYVLRHAHQLADDIGGKSVFTADHGELFGDWLWPVPIRGYAHPRHLHHPALVMVPWAEKTVGSRRRIEKGDISDTGTEIEQVTKQLKKLGYLQ